MHWIVVKQKIFHLMTQEKLYAFQLKFLQTIRFLKVSLFFYHTILNVFILPYFLIMFAIPFMLLFIFNKGKRLCMNFVRSQACLKLDCEPGPLQQINQITHWLDGSGIYGSSGMKKMEWNTFKNHECFECIQCVLLIPGQLSFHDIKCGIFECC